ncbi:hypothetical protein B0H14DRAFT_3608261 [Mycena olivaceomarginata]|nr:hypothetical protein B0H14DRAFT_3608261 [Mycena olivaceomarginata]
MASIALGSPRWAYPPVSQSPPHIPVALATPRTIPQADHIRPTYDIQRHTIYRWVPPSARRQIDNKITFLELRALPACAYILMPVIRTHDDDKSTCPSLTTLHYVVVCPDAIHAVPACSSSVQSKIHTTVPRRHQIYISRGYAREDSKGRGRGFALSEQDWSKRPGMEYPGHIRRMGGGGQHTGLGQTRVGTSSSERGKESCGILVEKDPNASSWLGLESNEVYSAESNDVPQLPGLMSPILVAGGVGLFVETRVFNHEKFRGPGPELGL